MTKERLKVGIIAAEHSSDRLGAKIIESLQDIFEIDLYGLGGPEVNANPIVTPNGIDYHDLHVMGLIDPLIKLPKILLNRNYSPIVLYVPKDNILRVGMQTDIDTKIIPIQKANNENDDNENDMNAHNHDNAHI